MTELELNIVGLVAQAFGSAAEDVSLASSFKNELAATSLAMVSLIANIEDEFDVMIPISEAAKFVTVEDLVRAVQAEM